MCLSSELKTEWEAHTQLSLTVFLWLHFLSPRRYIKLLCLFYSDVATGLQLQHAPHLKHRYAPEHINTHVLVHIVELQASTQRVHYKVNTSHSR